MDKYLRKEGGKKKKVIIAYDASDYFKNFVAQGVELPEQVVCLFSYFGGFCFPSLPPPQKEAMMLGGQKIQRRENWMVSASFILLTATRLQFM